MTQITVTVDEKHLSSIRKIATDLASNGMEVDQVLERTGFITGTVPSGEQSALARVPGVASVDEQRVVQLAPPDADVQ